MVLVVVMFFDAVHDSCDAFMGTLKGYFHEVFNEFAMEGYTADADLLKFLQTRQDAHSGGGGGGGGGNKSAWTDEKDGKDEKDEKDDDEKTD